VDLGLFALHVVVGLLFVGHGMQKLTGAFGGHGLAGTAQFMDSLGMRPGSRYAEAAGVAETAGGLMLLFGFFTPAAAALIIAVMVTATITVHIDKGLWNQEGGFELPLVYATAAFALAAVGAGSWSLDAAFGVDVASAVWGIAALLVGAIAGVSAVIVGRGEYGHRGAHERPQRPARRRTGDVAAYHG
jgi:putative oxidoreductase